MSGTAATPPAPGIRLGCSSLAFSLAARELEAGGGKGCIGPSFVRDAVKEEEDAGAVLGCDDGGGAPFDGVDIVGSVRNSRSSSTVGRNPVELKTEELQVVVEVDDSRNESGPPAAEGSDVTGTVLLLELLQSILQNSFGRNLQIH
jgi:hypothetical protein